MELLQEYFKKEQVVWDKLQEYLEEKYGKLVANDAREQYLRMSIEEHDQENKQVTIKDVKF